MHLCEYRGRQNSEAQKMSDASKDAARVVAHRLAPSSQTPNHPRWPLLVYPGAVAITGPDPALTFETLFDLNHWPSAWRNGVYPFHHFHSNAHEVLGVYSGEVTVQFGGDNGVTVTAHPGDVIVLPAGTGHKKLSSKGALGVVGAYPAGQQHPDLCKALVSNTDRHSEAIARVGLPDRDPVYGEAGPLLTHWTR
jgi:uncharacterized protein YjlB